jgi:16S rRNA (guanine527-N7)-methyltransferase
VNRALGKLAAAAPLILDRPITDREVHAFDKYLELLLKWQRVQRLIGSSDPEWIVENLFLDSLLFLRVLPREIQSAADLGSGAGLPGLPIKIVRPELRITLIESRARRVSFLAAVVRELALEGVRLMNARAEDVAAGHQETFGAVLIRCAGDLDDVVPVARKLAGPDGVVIASGPPRERPLKDGRWVEVEGVGPGRVRRFAVFQPATPS